MSDNRHAESISKELTSLPSRQQEQVHPAEPPKSQGGTSTEIKRNRQGLRRDELSSSEVLDATVLNLGDLARQTIQHQADCPEPWRFGPADDPTSSRTQDVAPHHELDIAHRDAC